MYPGRKHCGSFVCRSRSKSLINGLCLWVNPERFCLRIIVSNFFFKAIVFETFAFLFVLFIYVYAIWLKLFTLFIYLYPQINLQNINVFSFFFDSCDLSTPNSGGASLTPAWSRNWTVTSPISTVSRKTDYNHSVIYNGKQLTIDGLLRSKIFDTQWTLENLKTRVHKKRLGGLSLTMTSEIIAYYIMTNNVSNKISSQINLFFYFFPHNCCGRISKMLLVVTIICIVSVYFSSTLYVRLSLEGLRFQC